MDRAELGALRDAIDTILSWPDPVRDQIAQWLQPKTAKPNAAHHGTPSSRSSRHRGVGPGVEEAACDTLSATIPKLASSSGRRQPSAKRARFPCGLADWRGAASSSVTAKGAGGSPRQTLRRRRHSDGGGGSRASGAGRRRMPAVGHSDRGLNLARRSVAYSARPVRRRAGNDVPCSIWMSDRQRRDAAQGEGAPQYFLDWTGEDLEALARTANERP